MTKKDSLNIPHPTPNEIEGCLLEWEKPQKEENRKYAPQEKSLNKLFGKTYPLNNDLDDVLIKVSSLNDFYSTNIFSPYAVAKHIVELDIDLKLEQGDLPIVNTIAKVVMTEGKLPIDFYSFATKYCSHHKPLTYPIYDSYVVKMLLYFKKYDEKFDQFYSFKKESLRTYEIYKEAISKFREFYGLTKFNLKEIDKYLWMKGKEHFPKDFSRK